MNGRFINFTNHPSDRWEEAQRERAMEYGEIWDMAFPAVDPYQDEQYIRRLAEIYVNRIMELSPRAVLCQGEFTLAYQVISRLLEKGVTVLAACSERRVRETDQGKEVIFTFYRFRKYEK